MTEPLDESLQRLTAFNELLRSSIPVLDSGTADLDRLGHELSDAEGRLSLELDGMTSDLDELQKEAQSSSDAAVAACQGLDDVAEDARATAIAEVEKGAAAMQERWTHDLGEHATALAGAFHDLLASGWEPLIAALASEEGDFEHWTQTADEMLGTIVHLFTTAGGEFEHATPDISGAAQEFSGLPLFDHAWWNEPREHAETLLQPSRQAFREASLAVGKDLAETYHQLVATAGEDGSQVRALLDQVTDHAAYLLDTHASELMQTLAETVEAVGRVQGEVERSAVQAERTQTAAHEMADLSAQVVEGDATVRQIEVVMEAMSP